MNSAEIIEVSEVLDPKDIAYAHHESRLAAAFWTACASVTPRQLTAAQAVAIEVALISRGALEVLERIV